MTTPVRLQRSRGPGFRLRRHSVAINGLDVVAVDRTSRFGNPYRVGEPVHAGMVQKWGWQFSDLRFVCDTAETAVRRFAACLAKDEAIHPYLRSILGGRNLACWCDLCPRHADAGKPFDEHCTDCPPCHADPLGRVANR